MTGNFVDFITYLSKIAIKMIKIAFKITRKIDTEFEINKLYIVL